MGMVNAYAYDQSWEHERERLAGIESLFDPITIRQLEQLGVGPGWRCLEVGAGGGSIAAWLCERVGLGGRVVATDVNTRYLVELRHPSLEVRRHDVVSEGFEPEWFDLVHARMVLEHLPGREEALRHLIAALKPGGWLVVEDLDMQLGAESPSAGVQPAEAAGIFGRVARAFFRFFDESGLDPAFARELPGLLRSNGIEDADASIAARLIRGASPRTEFFRLSLESLRGVMEERGFLTPSEADQALALLDDPGFAVMSPALVTAWGRRRRE
jgi:SAM-dependent methyltransferase